MTSNSSILQDDFIIHLSDTFTFDRSTFKSNYDSECRSYYDSDYNSTISPSSSEDENNFERTHKKINEPQKYKNKTIYQQRFNKLVFNIEKVSLLDKLKLKLK
jgi:hypothetical protein